jgi:hypothetical protein
MMAAKVVIAVFFMGVSFFNDFSWFWVSGIVCQSMCVLYGFYFD